MMGEGSGTGVISVLVRVRNGKYSVIDGCRYIP